MIASAKLSPTTSTLTIFPTTLPTTSTPTIAHLVAATTLSPSSAPTNPVPTPLPEPPEPVALLGIASEVWGAVLSTIAAIISLAAGCKKCGWWQRCCGIGKRAARQRGNDVDDDCDDDDALELLSATNGAFSAEAVPDVLPTSPFGTPIIDPAAYDDVAEISHYILQHHTELRRKDIKLQGLLGSGEFGKVRCGELVAANGGRRVVACKTLRKSASKAEQKDFLAEAAVMGQFRHPNVVSLVGVVSSKPQTISIELMSTGELKGCGVLLHPTLHATTSFACSNVISLGVGGILPSCHRVATLTHTSGSVRFSDT